MSGETRRRLAENQAFYREINEGIGAAGEAFAGEGLYEFVCECSDLDCHSPILASLEEYRAVRRHAARFLIVSGHERAELERVVERTDRYDVVERADELDRDEAA